MQPVLFATIGAMVLVAAISAGLWARRPGARPIIGGVGALLGLAGLYLLGVMQLLYNGIVSIVDWVARTAWDQTMTWGAGLLGGGLLLLVVARFLKSAPLSSERQSTTPAKQAPAHPGSPARPAAPTPRQVPPPAAGTTQKTGVDPEDAEIEALLRKRGIM